MFAALLCADVTDGPPEGAAGACSHFAQQGFELGEYLRRDFRRISRQEQEPGAPLGQHSAPDLPADDLS